MPNAELCYQVADLAEGSAKHDQNQWFGDLDSEDIGLDVAVPVGRMKEDTCGTTCCIGGYATLLTAPDDWQTDGAYLYDGDGKRVHRIEDWAAEQLGLDTEQADSIFFCFDNAMAIRQLRAVAAGKEVSA